MSASPLPMDIVSGDRDGRLVEALRHGESSAAERLVTTYQDRAYRLAIRIAGNAPDAEEIVQDAFLTVIRRIDTFRGKAALGSWFCFDPMRAAKAMNMRILDRDS
jgi:RNA polymerase sigma-70 factor, ECF subfamily